MAERFGGPVFSRAHTRMFQFFKRTVYGIESGKAISDSGSVLCGIYSSYLLDEKQYALN